ncbi:MAG TPA: ATP-grasp domain-containing protein [Polyangia bacterium]
MLIAHQPARVVRAEDGTPAMETSILSAVRDVETALREREHLVERVTITRELHALQRTVRRYRPQVIFNLCERINNDGRLEKNAIALYEILGKPFTGNGSLPLGLCQRKSLAKQILKAAKMPTPEFLVATLDNVDTLHFPLPAIVKPLYEDGSNGISMRSVVKSAKALRSRVQYVLRKFRQPALIEAYIVGRELQVALLGNQSPQILAVAQLSYRGLPRSYPKICSYAAKWDPKSKYYTHTNPLIPAGITPKLQARIEHLAAEVFKLFDLRGYARIDLRVRGGKPYVIDINPNPDISADAGFARAARAAGLSYPDLINRIVELAQES